MYRVSVLVSNNLFASNWFFFYRGIVFCLHTTIVGVNECANDPCNGHQCLQKISGYACQCSDGFHGTHCELKPDYCKQDPCQNGASCNNTEDGKYTCLCPDGFKGIRCEKKIGNI